MKILVLNGSPKGDNSVTMAYIKYLKIGFPQHDFKVKHITQSIHRLEKDQEVFNELIAEVKQSDVVLWSFPLYFLLVHGNYKRFIELIFERGQQEAFAGKYTAAFSTSIHFYDHTAHNYLRGICEDLEMNFVSAFSAGMQDLLNGQERENLNLFMENIIYVFENKSVTSVIFPKLKQPELKYQPAQVLDKLDPGDQKIIILTDTESMSDNLRSMLQRFQGSFSKELEVVDLAEIKIAGGCLGCLKCGMDNQCAYDGKDDVRTIYEEKLRKADIIVYALTMKDRYFSARWKNFLDRRFYKTHQPGLPGKQIGYLISGPLSYEQNLRQILLASAEIDQANLVDIITDEFTSSVQLDLVISEFSHKLLKYGNRKAKQPRTFLGVGGGKIFRDEMWGNLRFIFQADYKYYKSHGMIDFPQSNFSTQLMHLFIPFIRLSPIKKQVQAKTTTMMHKAHDMVLQQEEEKRKQQQLG